MQKLVLKCLSCLMSRGDWTVQCQEYTVSSMRDLATVAQHSAALSSSGRLDEASTLSIDKKHAKVHSCRAYSS